MKNNHKGTPEELRRRAEEKVIADKSVSAAQERVTPAETLAAIETQRLLHELQVHQVELEMQNEELRFSQRDLETANEHYRTLIDNVPGITYTFSAKHGGQFYSPQVEQVFGYPLQDFYDDPLLWKNSIHPADKENVEHAIRNDGEKNQSGLSLEYRVRIKSGEWIWLRDCIFQRREVDDDIIIFGIAQDITDYKTAEDARKESQQQLLMAQEIGKTGSWIYNLETNKIWGSAEGFRMYGFPPIAGHISVDDIEACIPERERVHQTLVRLIRGEGEYDIEFAINPADGSPAKTVHSVARLSQDENGAPKVFGFVQDITERIRMEEVQHEASRQLAARTNALQRLTHQQSIIFDNAGVGIAHVQNRRFIRINPALCSMFGYDPDEITGADTRIIYPSQEDYEQTGRDAYAVLDGGGTFSRELILQRKDGTLFHALYNGKAIDPAEPQAGSIWIISDETEYFELKESLQKSHDLLATLSRQLPGLIYQYRLYPDDRSCFPYVSDTISEMFGVSPEDIREDAAPLFARIHPDDLDELRESIAESARTMEFWEHDFRVKLSHYRISWCHGFSRPEQLAVGSVLWHGFISDITSQKKLEAELNIARDDAHAASRAKSEFLANMSHEIRTPMNGVIGMAQLLEFTPLSKEQQECVTSLKQSGKNLLLLINDILDLTKIEAGKVKIELTEFNLQHCISDVVLTQRTTIYEKGLKLTVVIDEDVPGELIGDQLRIKQILLNLLGNAVKFTTHGSIAISAHCRERHHDSVLIELAVRDSGIGISEEALGKIFRPFVQEEDSTTRRFGGTGLGLTICRTLAELMGGSISVESTPGSGSCFKIILPFTISHHAEAAIESRQDMLAIWDGNPLRILFVEDNPINTMFGTSLLEKLGHEVVTAENGRECLARLQEGRFDLILMDIQLPVMNGEEALREIRSVEGTSGQHLPVIALTAYALRGEKERFLEEGFDGYVSKPIVVETLIEEMRRVMDVNTSGNVPV